MRKSAVICQDRLQDLLISADFGENILPILINFISKKQERKELALLRASVSSSVLQNTIPPSIRNSPSNPTF